VFGEHQEQIVLTGTGYLSPVPGQGSARL